MYKFGTASKENLVGVNPDLIEVCELALTYSKYDFGITSGVRTLEQQQEMIDKGASNTIDSRHLSGHAVDIIVYVNGTSTYRKKFYSKVASSFFKAAIELGVDLEWGGHWESLFDGPHFQLSKVKYP